MFSLRFAGCVQAAIEDYDIFKTLEYQQTSSSAPIAASKAFLNFELDVDNPGELGSVVVSYGGPASPVSLTASGTSFLYQSGYVTPAQLDSDFPNGIDYTFTTSGGTLGAGSRTYSLSATPSYPGVPALTGNSYNAIQSITTLDPVTLTENGFPTPSGVQFTDGYQVLTITKDSDGSVAFLDGLISPTTTSFVIPSGSLEPSTTYHLELEYFTRIATFDDGFFIASSQRTYVEKTEIGFTTTAAGVPEPVTTALLALPLCLLRRGRLKR